MNTWTSFLALGFSVVFSAGLTLGQAASPESPFDRDDLLRGLANPDFAEVTELTEAIQRRGIDFDLTNEQIGAILAAGVQGKRDPAQMAVLLMTSLRACQKCRAQFIVPLSLEELLISLKRSHDNDLLLQEVKARGVKDLDISEATANVLRAAGANEELVGFLVPDDKVKISPLIGYKMVELKHAEDYDTSATEGWLKITAQIPANSTSEFIFKHNSLFAQAVAGAEPTNVTAYFNKPAPRNTKIDLLQFSGNLEGGEATAGDEKRGFLGIGKGKPKDEKAKDAPPLEVAYLGADDTGRNSFQIRVANKQSTPQQSSFTLRWMVLTAPKPLTVIKASPAPAKK